MELNQPVKIYTAEDNAEAIIIVEMLKAHGLAAFVEEDQFWALGALTQLRRPNVWVEEAMAQKATDLIRQYDARKWERAHPAAGTSHVEVRCEECGNISSFPDSLLGTVQDCPHCGAYVDVGELDWDVGSDEPDGS